MNLLLVATIVIVVAFVSGTQFKCQPDEVKFFSTLDATITETVAYVAEFSLKCESYYSMIDLHAIIDHQSMPVSILNNKNLQVNWLEHISAAKRGQKKLTIVDDDQYQKLGILKTVDELVPISNVLVYHPGTYTGSWFGMEVIIFSLSIALVYKANQLRNEIMSKTNFKK